VVALSGGPEGDLLLRRAASLARPTGGTLLAVHVARTDVLVDTGIGPLTAARSLVESLGGSYHSVVGDDIPQALLDFARGHAATQILLGAPRNPHRRRPSTRPRGLAARLVGHLDVVQVAHDLAEGPALPVPGRGLTGRRRVAGLVTAAVLLTGFTLSLAGVRGHVSFASDVSIYLFAVVLTSLVGGFSPALLSAVVGSLLLNYYFVPPVHTFTIDRRDNVLALVIFLLVAVLVSRVVDLAARRSTTAARASAEAETISTFAGSLLRGDQAIPALLERVQETFGMRGVSLLRRSAPSPRGPEASGSDSRWELIAGVGEQPPVRPEEADCTAYVHSSQLLALRGRILTPEDKRVLSAFAAHVTVAHRQQELADTLAPLAESERARTALLNAVSHDLRTPIAAAKTSVSSLRAADVSWSVSDSRELLATADEALDRLTDLVTNLLDLSRLQAGVLPVLTAPVGIDDVVSRALDHAAPRGAAIAVDVPDDLPEVLADAGLLERVIANLVQNALRYAPDGSPVRILGRAEESGVQLRVVDTGRGIAAADADAVFAAFQRRDDIPEAGAGVGLGLAIARGFTEAMGGTVTAEQTCGGGATLVVRLRAAQALT
jgi:two-component system sensor histidine kinase KdpD